MIVRAGWKFGASRRWMALGPGQMKMAPSEYDSGAERRVCLVLAGGGEMELGLRHYILK